MELKFLHRSKKFHHFHFHLLLHETFNILPPDGDDDIVPLVLTSFLIFFRALDYFHGHFLFALALSILFILLLIFLIFQLV